MHVPFEIPIPQGGSRLATAIALLVGLYIAAAILQKPAPTATGRQARPSP